MAKRQRRTFPPSSDGTKAVGRPRKTDEQVRAEGFTPFLRPEHTKSGAWFSITGWNTEHRDKQQIIVEVQDEDGIKFSFGVRIGSPDHRVLHQALGADWKSWTGGLSVEFRKGNKGDVEFVNVATADRADPFV
jgi:hypothetical protein